MCIRDRLQSLEDGLLELEQAGEDDEVIGQIFRAAHTLKGSSATLGHDKMANLTHSMAVSYTHLDVYKRQFYGECARPGSKIAARGGP